MRALLIALVAFAALAGCATDRAMLERANRVVDKNRAELAQRGPCCRSITEFEWVPMRSGQEIEVLLDQNSPVFEFDSGKSYFISLRLPPWQAGARIDIGSRLLGSTSYIGPSGTDTLFYPLWQFYDESFELLEAPPRGNPATLQPGLVRLASPRWTVELTPALATARYLVIYTDPDYAGIENTNPRHISNWEQQPGGPPVMRMAGSGMGRRVPFDLEGKLELLYHFGER